MNRFSIRRCTINVFWSVIYCLLLGYVCYLNLSFQGLTQKIEKLAVVVDLNETKHGNVVSWNENILLWWKSKNIYLHQNVQWM